MGTQFYNFMRIKNKLVKYLMKTIQLKMEEGEFEV